MFFAIIVIIQWDFCMHKKSDNSRYNLISSSSSLSVITWKNRNIWDRLNPEKCHFCLWESTPVWLARHLLCLHRVCVCVFVCLKCNDVEIHTLHILPTGSCGLPLTPTAVCTTNTHTNTHTQIYSGQTAGHYPNLPKPQQDRAFISSLNVFITGLNRSEACSNAHWSELFWCFHRAEVISAVSLKLNYSCRTSNQDPVAAKMPSYRETLLKHYS